MQNQHNLLMKVWHTNNRYLFVMKEMNCLNMESYQRLVSAQNRTAFAQEKD